MNTRARSLIPVSSAWFVCPRPNPAADFKVFCFPYAGGGPSVFMPWAALLPDSVELWCASLPGRGVRFAEQPIASPGVLIDSLLADLAPRLDRPYAFFGHSMGGLIALELTLRLKRAQYPAPRKLWLSACTPPHLPPSWEAMSHLPEAEFLSRLSQLGGTPPALLANHEFMTMLLPALRADFSFCEQYRGRDCPPLDPPLSVFAGSGDTMAPPEALTHWQAFSRHPLEQTVFEGDHFFLNDRCQEVAQHVLADAARLTAYPA